MNIPRIFIQRPVATILLSIALVLGGILGYIMLPVAELPNVDFPVIIVRAQQPGGTPQEIASSVAAPLERHLGQIPGTTEMTSQSTQNQVRIILQFDLSRDVNSAARDVEAALQAARADLPSSLRTNPTYFKANPASTPIIVLAVTSKTRTLSQLYDYATNVVQQRLAAVKGVGEVDIGGSSLPAIRVELNPLPLFKYGIGFEDIRAALASANAHTPKGFIDEGEKRYQLATNDQVTSAQDYKDLIVAYRNNSPVRLNDVAEIRDSVEDVRNIGFFNKEPAIIMVIFPQANANIIDTTNAIHARIPQISNALPPDININICIDRSLPIRASLADTQLTLIISVILVIFVVLVFLHDLRSVLIPSIVVPTSIIATFGFMHLLGYSLDNFSLIALTISTGFVVDDAIVVLENISRHIEAGMSPKQAALYGAKEVSFTVISITISLIAIFLPILLLGGIIGRLFHEFAMTLTITLLTSLVLSLTLTPMMCAYMLKHRHRKPKTESRFKRLNLCINFCERNLQQLSEFYQKSLHLALRYRLLVALSLPATIILMVFLFIEMPKGFFPNEDTGLLICRLQGDQSISFQRMKEKLIEAQNALLADKDVEYVSAFTGGRAVNQSSIFVKLISKKDRKDSMQTTIARLSKRLSNMVGARFYMYSPGAILSSGRSSNALYQYTLQGDSAEELYKWMPKLVLALQKHHDIITDVSSDVQQGGEAMNIDILRDTAARVLITPQLIANTLYDAFGQRAASVIYNPLNQYRVIMEVAPRFWNNPNTLKQMWVSVAGGSAGGGTISNTIKVQQPHLNEADQISQQNFRNQIANSLAGGNGASNGSAVSTDSETMVPLSVVTRKTPALTALTVNHQGQFVAATLSFNLAKNKSLSDAVHLIKSETANIHLPKNISGFFAGNAAQFLENNNNEILIILGAIAAVYITLGILYESYAHPITILSTLPSAGVGALIALNLFGQEFSLVAMIGIILLIGIVKKNAILMIDFAINAERIDNMKAEESILLACKLRFRPIMMTSIAAAMGAVPLIVTSGYGNEIRRPLGIAIVGGMIMSQALTLYTTPVMYLYIDKFRSWWNSKFFKSKETSRAKSSNF